MVWIELSFTVDCEQVERWSDALLACGALSVQVEDADANSDAEQALFGEPGEAPPAPGWARSRLRALIECATHDHLAGLELIAGAASLAAAPVPQQIERIVVPERDWVAETQSQFQPIEIGQRLRISPSWHIDPASIDKRTIVLDPGLAFGTGSHPTTRMCLRWIERNMRDGLRVIDYGCGSGILAIAAARLGAAEVEAIDIDDQALRSTADNAAANGVHLSIRSSRDAAPEPADLVIANILANPLRLLAPLLESLLRPGATLLLAGLLERQVDELIACYPHCDMSVDQLDEGWACLHGLKRA